MNRYLIFAKKEDILRAFDQFLLLNAERDGQVLFYFSGHGGQMFDLNSDEADSLYESILPHDAHRDSTQEAKDISDDELSDLLEKLAVAGRKANLNQLLSDILSEVEKDLE